MTDKIATVFRTRNCKEGKKITEALRVADIDQEQLQVVYIGEQPAIATFFRVLESPTVLLFEDGEETVRHEGKIPPKVILDFLTS
jgi:thioredoxin-like negative regulator of GroEL